MDALRKHASLAVVVAVTALALALLAGPVAAQEEPADGPPAEAPADEQEDHRIAIAQTPRDRLGLLFLGALVVASALGLANARRQLKGERPQASGEFRWR